MGTPLRSLLPMLVATLGLAGDPGLPPAVVKAEPLVELSTTIQTVTPENHLCEMLLLNALPPGAKADRDLKLTFSRVDGAFKGGCGEAKDWNMARHTVDDLGDLRIADGRMKGAMKVTLKPDAWVPADKKDIPLLVRIDAAVAPLKDLPEEPSLAQDGQWWRIFPKAQAATLALEGTFELLVAGSQDSATGRVGGTLGLPVSPGHWDMGRWQDGIAFTFAMGTKRQSWNHARIAQLEISADGRDCSAFHGLRLRLTTRQPRVDASTTVWVAEADGSWYYVKDAIPLAAKENEIVLLWEDFEEAEWVSPTNHLDEDYVLDTRHLSRIGLGVVNPLGVGTVEFTLTALELVTCEFPAEPPAVVLVSGRTLAVNDHQVLPAALIGGYAGDLPPEFRPGCQRTLHFGLTGHPDIPRMRAARIRGASILDEAALAKAIKVQADAAAPTPGKRLWELLDERGRQTCTALAAGPAKDDKDRGERRDRLAGTLNELAQRKDLYQDQAWASVALDERARSGLRKLAEGTITTTEIRELDRDLLVAAFPALLAPRDPQGPSEQFIIDCQGERFQPAPYLNNPNWEKDLEGVGRAYGENAKAAGYRAHMEFWNEPYLNWAERSRINYNVDFYRTDLAQDGGPVAVKRPSVDWPGLLNGLVPVLRTTDSAAARHLLGMLPDDLQTTLRKTEPDPATRAAVVKALQAAVMAGKCYDPVAWKDIPMDPALRWRLDAEHRNGAVSPENQHAGLLAAFAGQMPNPPQPLALDLVPCLRWAKTEEKVSKTATGLKVIDTSAFSYWSGRGNGYMYDRMYGAMARGIKAANPAVVCIAGWGFRWHEDHWGAWDILYRPSIDRNISWIDGIHEHHYQGDPTDLAGSYEVLVAYAKTTHDKWLHCYNTECNDLVDAPARGGVDTPDRVAATKDYRRCVYSLRDILYLMSRCPDKAAGRTVIHWDQSRKGMEVCFGGILLNLRGRMVETASADDRVWCVASVDGTDPEAMPARPGQTLVAVVFNDHRRPRKVDFTIQAPPGTTFASAVVERLVRNPQTFAVDLAREEPACAKDRFSASFTLNDRSAWKVSLPLAGAVQAQPDVERRQCFSPDILRQVLPGKPFSTVVRIDPKLVKSGRRAWLRAVVEDIAPGEAQVTIGTLKLTLPKSYTRDNGNDIRDCEIDPRSLGPETPVTFSVADGGYAGYRVDMTSIVVETAR